MKVQKIKQEGSVFIKFPYVYGKNAGDELEDQLKRHFGCDFWIHPSNKKPIYFEIKTNALVNRGAGTEHKTAYASVKSSAILPIVFSWLKEDYKGQNLFVSGQHLIISSDKECPPIPSVDVTTLDL